MSQDVSRTDDGVVKAAAEVVAAFSARIGKESTVSRSTSRAYSVLDSMEKITYDAALELLHRSFKRA